MRRLPSIHGGGTGSEGGSGRYSSSGSNFSSRTSSGSIFSSSNSEAGLVGIVLGSGIRQYGTLLCKPSILSDPRGFSKWSLKQGQRGMHRLDSVIQGDDGKWICRADITLALQDASVRV